MGGSSNSAARQAEASERARQAAIKDSVGKIDNVFSSPARQAQYADFLGASRGIYNDELKTQQERNARELKFSLARSGNAGGSLQVDQGTDLAKAFQKGVIESDRLAQSDLSSLMQSDSDARRQLISMAQGGLDATTGVRNATSALQSNLQAGRSTNNVKAIGDVFSDFSSIFKTSREEAARRKGERYAYNTLYQPGYFTGQTGAQN